ncbi:hypothetical protein [Streptomyces sp. SID8111]|uniref:hypothetical protein n=1 Tax=Streptomyces sp. SID8111 TaxID=2706100 RepID=UPI001EF1E251|nr:hypothetical protein [Streptomyces sp. SID8111]
MRTEAAKRVELVFSLFDANGNGVVDSDDFDLMTERVLEAAVASDDSAKEAIRAAFRRYWTTLATELDTSRKSSTVKPPIGLRRSSCTVATSRVALSEGVTQGSPSSSSRERSRFTSRVTDRSSHVGSAASLRVAGRLDGAQR